MIVEVVTQVCVGVLLLLSDEVIIVLVISILIFQVWVQKKYCIVGRARNY